MVLEVENKKHENLKKNILKTNFNLKFMCKPTKNSKWVRANVSLWYRGC